MIPSMEGETSKHEPLSPELALIDPELAAAARERLPDVPESYAVPSVPYEFASRFVAEYERAARKTGDRAEPKPPRRRRGRYLALAVALLAVPVALWAMDWRGDDDVARSSTPAVEAAPPAAPTAAPTAPPQPPTVEKQTSKAPKQQKTGRPRAASRRADRSGRGRSAVPQRSRSAPVVHWAPVGRATFYWFQLYRVGLPGTQKILDAYPRRPQLEVPGVWTNAGRRYRLAAGRYRWEVWPQFGAPGQVRYTRKLTQGTFRVEPR
jgi:hypothetical protein